MAYHWRVAVHNADHLDVNLLLVHILQEPHHLAYAHPFAIYVAHGNNVVTLFQTIGLEKTQGRTVREEEQ